MNNEPTYRPQAAEINSQFLQLTNNIKKRIFVQMNKDVIPKIASGDFAFPKKPLFGSKKGQKERKMSVSTHVPSNENSSQMSKRVEENNPSKGFTPKMSAVAGDKKFKIIISMLLNFEENCIVSKVVENKKLQQLRRYSRRFLGFLIHDSEAVRLQHSDSLGLAILLHSAIKIGMSKRNFVEQVQPLARRKNLSVSYVRKSKCYGIVKDLIAKNRRRIKESQNN